MFFLFFFMHFFSTLKNCPIFPYRNDEEKTCSNLLKHVEMCRNMSKTAFLSWPILISRKSFLHYHSKAFSFIRKQKQQNTASVYTSYIRKWNVQKNEENFFYHYYYHIFLIFVPPTCFDCNKKMKKTCPKSQKKGQSMSLMKNFSYQIYRSD